MPSMMLPQAGKRAYVATMMGVISRALVAASRSDARIRHEFAGLRDGYRIAMTVFPSGPGFLLEVHDGGLVDRVAGADDSADLIIRFKHLDHAWLVFSFQEGTARAFANDRMIADGEVSDAIRLVRCLNRMETLILPRLIARRAVKDYGDLGLPEKSVTAARIYARLAAGFVGRKRS
ncbi:hypothetical protein [Algiphilus sp.]|uniref:hypothetical protein n=1 Tax=Algiphilus sp. TaxID=1872431 RepID=UPI003451E7EC